jgi:hypothetical protein
MGSKNATSWHNNFPELHDIKSDDKGGINAPVSWEGCVKH